MCMAAALLSCGIVLTGCNTNDPAEEYTYNTLQTATIKGKVLVNLDNTVEKPLWAAIPASYGPVIEATVANKDITGKYS